MMALSWVELTLSRIKCVLPVMSISCSLVVTCWERAEHLAPFYVSFFCCHLPLPHRVLGHVRYLIASIPDLCLLFYFAHGQYAVPPMRLKPATLLSRLKHPTTGYALAYCVMITMKVSNYCYDLNWSKRSRSNISYKC